MHKTDISFIFQFSFCDYRVPITPYVMHSNSAKFPRETYFQKMLKGFPAANFSFQDLGILRAYGAAKPSSPMLIKYYQFYSFNFGEKFSYQTQKKAQQQTCRDLIIFRRFLSQ